MKIPFIFEEEQAAYDLSIYKKISWGVITHEPGIFVKEENRKKLANPKYVIDLFGFEESDDTQIVTEDKEEYTKNIERLKKNLTLICEGFLLFK